MNRITLLILSFFLINSAKGQSSSSFVASDFSIYFGAAENGGTMSESDLLTLAPSASEFLFEEVDDYHRSFSSGSDSYSFNALIGLKFARKGSEGLSNNPTLRIGISYQHFNSLEYHSGSSEVYRIDTLISTQTGEMTFIDSTSRRSLSAQYITERLALDASVIFRSTQEKRLSLYAGAGVTIGVSFNNRTEVNLYQSNNLEGNDMFFGFEGTDRNLLTVSNDGGLAMSAYVPLGLDYRLGKSHPMWSKIHLSYEMRPGIDYYNIPELKTFTDSRFNIMLGLRYEVGPVF